MPYTDDNTSSNNSPYRGSRLPNDDRLDDDKSTSNKKRRSDYDRDRPYQQSYGSRRPYYDRNRGGGSRGNYEREGYRGDYNSAKTRYSKSNNYRGGHDSYSRGGFSNNYRGRGGRYNTRGWIRGRGNRGGYLGRRTPPRNFDRRDGDGRNSSRDSSPNARSPIRSPIRSPHFGRSPIRSPIKSPIRSYRDSPLRNASDIPRRTSQTPNKFPETKERRSEIFENKDKNTKKLSIDDSDLTNSSAVPKGPRSHQKYYQDDYRFKSKFKSFDDDRDYRDSDNSNSYRGGSNFKNYKSDFRRENNNTYKDRLSFKTSTARSRSYSSRRDISPRRSSLERRPVRRNWNKNRSPSRSLSRSPSPSRSRSRSQPRPQPRSRSLRRSRSLSRSKSPRRNDTSTNSSSKTTTPIHTPLPSSSTIKTEENIEEDSKNISIFSQTHNSSIYKRLAQVGEGTYGKVYKAINIVTKQKVALKYIRMEGEKEGFPITAIREIRLLQSFNHKNVVSLLEIMIEKNGVFMIFNYMDHDLTGILTHPTIVLNDANIKDIFKQLTEGVCYLHSRGVLHRDLKGPNILVDQNGTIQITDFGLARKMKSLPSSSTATTSRPDYSNRVITLWYRPPELLFGSTAYGPEVDIWGLGCLLVELFTRTAIFQGMDEIHQLVEIFNIMGTPDENNWNDVKFLPWYQLVKPRQSKQNRFKELYGDKLPIDAFDLATKLLTMDPNKRISAQEALDCEYFQNDPKPEPLTNLKELGGEWHEFESKKRRRKEREERKKIGKGSITDSNKGTSEK